MTREADVVQSLVDLATTLVDDYDVVDHLTRLADRCVSVIGAAAAGVMLASSNGELRLVASSSDAMRVLELFELQAQEGPCPDAFRTGVPVGQEDLHAGSGRWPRFSTVAHLAAPSTRPWSLPPSARGSPRRHRGFRRRWVGGVTRVRP